MSSTDAIVVLVAVGSLDEGRAIAEALVAERLAACVNLIGPIRSIYRWQDEVHDDAEHLLIIKTRRGRFDALERRVVGLHSYDVPEVVALPVTAGSAAYLGWLTAETSDSQ